MAIHIRDLRERYDLTLEELSKLAGVPLEIVQDIEAGMEEVGGADVEGVYRALRSSIHAFLPDDSVHESD